MQMHKKHVSHINVPTFKTLVTWYENIKLQTWKQIVVQLRLKFSQTHTHTQLDPLLGWLTTGICTCYDSGYVSQCDYKTHSSCTSPIIQYFHKHKKVKT